MGDVRLFHTVDGGEIAIEEGRFTLDNSPLTAAYLSLFGGNEEDGGTVATERAQWWGNITEPDRTRHYRSETQHLLRGLPAVSANILRVQDAATRDLEWMREVLGAEVTVRVTMPARRRLRIDVGIGVDGESFRLGIEAPWGADA